MPRAKIRQTQTVRPRRPHHADRRSDAPAAAPPDPRDCLGLGTATDYNAFVFDNFDARYTETEGRLAVGGSANLQGYGVGVRLSNSRGRRDGLIVGGNLNYTHGQTFAGNIVCGGNANLTGIGGPNGNVRKDNVIDFAAAAIELTNRSDQFAALSANGSAVKQWDRSPRRDGRHAADFENCYGLSVNVPKALSLLSTLRAAT